MLQAPAFEVAPRLLGATVSTSVGGKPVSIRLDEVEAYDGANDPASHAYRGQTPRTLPMFDVPGTLYVYRSYGIHWCANVVTRPRGQASAVLLRGGSIVEGRDVVVARRGRETELTNGPGKLCQALAITGDLSGTRINGGVVQLTLGKPVDASNVTTTPRIGISKAVDIPWRFVLS